MEERTIVSLDYAIKYMLRDKANFGILSGFLTELLNKKVTVDAILESESNKDDPDGKSNRLDLKARIDDGEIAVFEIQFHQLVDFFGKVLFGVSKAIVEQVASGKPYDIKKVYSVNIAYYDLGAEREYLFSAKIDGFRGLHFEDEKISFAQAPISGKGPKADIHPEYYLILPKMFDGQLRGRFDEWIYVLQNSAVRENFTAAGIAEAADKLDYLKMTATEKATYDRFRDDRSDLDQVALTARAEGKAEGHAEGKVEGHAQGKAEGMAKVFELLEKGVSMADAKKMLGID
jgi:predicted transposase/invertase (TIGR01784 family)